MKNDNIGAYTFAKIVTPHNTNVITNANGEKVWPRGLMLDQNSTAGDVKIRLRGNELGQGAGSGGDITVGLAKGEKLVLQFDLVYATGTTATNIIVFW